MRRRIKVLAAALLLAGGACAHEPPIALSPNLMRDIAVPALGETAAAVATANGEPDAREPTADGRELWVYARLVPGAPPFRSRTASIWFRDGVVTDVRTTEGGTGPVPTFPLPEAASR
ncbi:MAG TPA: hypothetical protein VFZ20_15295 [Longimicrobium sp.]|nr:hypothetical protein [Longimicrobium sp.]